MLFKTLFQHYYAYRNTLIYGLIECNLTYPTQLGPKTWYMVCFKKQNQQKGFAIWFFIY